VTDSQEWYNNITHCMLPDGEWWRAIKEILAQLQNQPWTNQQ